MVIRKDLISFLLLLVLTQLGSACNPETPKIVSPIRLSDALVSYKSAFLRGQEISIFVEFVKYKELKGYTPSLTKYQNVTIEANTALTNSSQSTGGATVTISPTPSGQLTGTSQIQRQDQEGGKVSVTFGQLQPAEQKDIEDIFNKIDKNEVYRLAWYDSEAKKSYDSSDAGGKEISADSDRPCGRNARREDYPVCVPISELTVGQRQAFAYPLGWDSLRKLLRPIPPGRFFQ